VGGVHERHLVKTLSSDTKRHFRKTDPEERWGGKFVEEREGGMESQFLTPGFKTISGRNGKTLARMEDLVGKCGSRTLAGEGGGI